MSSIKKISSKDSLGSNIGCVTLTKQFFESNRMVDNSRKLLPLSFSAFNNLPVQYMDQIHGVSVETVRQHCEEPIPKTDALFSKSSQFSLAIMSADCLPIALANSKGTKIALLHAGWRGLSNGIINKSLEMFDLKTDRLRAWLAPCISQNYYEVGSDVFKAFVGTDPKSAKNFQQFGAKKWKFDIKAEASRILRKSGVSVSQSKYCTYKDEDLFYSYRRNKTERRVLTLLWRKNV